MTRLFIDLETRSPVPIDNGTWAYAEKAEILLFAYAIEDETVQVCDNEEGIFTDSELAKFLFDPEVTLIAHNSMFDRVCLLHNAHFMEALAARKQEKSDFLKRWQDTMVMALQQGFPGALAKLCDVLAIPQDKAKDKDGKRLIKLFCLPSSEGTRDTHPEDWERFREYTRLDVAAMREIYRQLSLGFLEDEEIWRLDQRINDRGFAVDLKLTEDISVFLTFAKKELEEELGRLTKGATLSTTRRAALLHYINSEFNAGLPNLQKETIVKFLKEQKVSPNLVKILNIRISAAKSSVSKYQALLNSVSSNNRLRGTLQYYGASRTGRWTGRIFQPQNLFRGNSSPALVEAGVSAFKAGIVDLCFKDVIGIASDCLRGSIIAPEGRKLIVADLSSIEARVLAGIAGEEWKLKAFQDIDNGKGEDFYKLAYARAFNVSVGSVDARSRHIGKIMELSLGYGGGVSAFSGMSLKYGVNTLESRERIMKAADDKILRSALWLYERQKENTPHLAEKEWLAFDILKQLWRKAHPQVVQLWEVLQAAFANNVTANTPFRQRFYSVDRDSRAVRVHLPSGRRLYYQNPKRSDYYNQLFYMGVNRVTYKWDSLHIYGGKLAENLVQATSRDILAHGMLAAERAGYNVVLTVHDEIVAEVDDTPEFNVKTLCRLMTGNIPWAKGLPLAAEGYEAKRYRK